MTQLQKIMRTLPAAAILATAATACTPHTNDSPKEINLTILQTTDIHGNFYPYDFINSKPAQGSWARLSTRISALRDTISPDNIILLDGGDILQGQPSAYYYNFIDTVAPHLAAQMINWLGYDAITIGNHDIETGHKVYDRFHKQLKMPLLGANIIDKATGEPYFTPYTIIHRQGLRIAILGLITPAIPAWLPENLWQGLQFLDMETTARKWIPQILQDENPHLIIGLFHSGSDSTHRTGNYIENASLQIAKNVPGFNAIFMGHDHTPHASLITNNNGDTIAILNAGSSAHNIARLDITLTNHNGKTAIKALTPTLENIDTIPPHTKFTNQFQTQHHTVNQFVSQQIGHATGSFTAIDSYFGPSAFMTLLHQLQLKIAKAQISFAAPLTFDAVIAQGPVKMADMFNLYKYENLLYTMRLTGTEIKNYLEESYAGWVDIWPNPGNHLLLLTPTTHTSDKTKHIKLKNPSYNFDSAYGINYTVDITKPKGQKINIQSMADGTPFQPTATYLVAINSYRGNGGGDLLTKGAQIHPDTLPSRIVRSTDKDLRYYLMQTIRQQHNITPQTHHNWQFIPTQAAQKGKQTDQPMLTTKK